MSVYLQIYLCIIQFIIYLKASVDVKFINIITKLIFYVFNCLKYFASVMLRDRRLSYFICHTHTYHTAPLQILIMSVTGDFKSHKHMK